MNTKRIKCKGMDGWWKVWMLLAFFKETGQFGHSQGRLFLQLLQIFLGVLGEYDGIHISLL